jgi:hypothetical protein
MGNLATPAKQSVGQGFSQIGTEKQKPSSKKQEERRKQRTHGKTVPNFQDRCSEK